MIGTYRKSISPLFGPLSGPPNAFEFCQRKHDYTKWRARLAYEPASSDYQVSLYGDNITDELIDLVTFRLYLITEEEITRMKRVQ